MRTFHRRSVIQLSLVVAALVPSGPLLARHQPETQAALAAFNDRLMAFVALRTAAEQSLPKLEDTKDPVKLTAQQKALAAAVIEKRQGAAASTVFVAACQPMLTRIVRENFAKRSRADRQALMKDMPPGTKVTVNAEYPDGLPLVTIPPSLLRALPALPDDMEYRLVGRDLILLDARSGVVVDVLRNVVPA